jgi:hypothetical protein
MTTREAKEILLLFRPGRGDEGDPQVAAALDLARSDPELQKWLEEQSAINDAIRQKLSSIPVPRTLKGDILLGPKVVRGPAQWWSRRVALAAAAAIVLFAVISSVWWNFQPKSEFTKFRARMVGSILREYHMDIVTNDMQRVRLHLAQKGAPADYTVPSGLRATSLTGAAALSWNGKPVSMVCFDRGTNDMVFMFVYRKQHLDNVPEKPELKPVSDLGTASWASGDKVYLLAASGPVERLRPYLPDTLVYP